MFVPGRTPEAGEAFSDKWNHLADVVIQKAIKDMTIRDYIQVKGGAADAQTINLDGVRSLFFDPYEASAGTSLKPQDPRQDRFQSKLLVNINAIIVTMQRYVLENMR